LAIEVQGLTEVARLWEREIKKPNSLGISKAPKRGRQNGAPGKSAPPVDGGL